MTDRKEISTKGRLHILIRSTLVLIAIAIGPAFASRVVAQGASGHAEMIRQIPAPPPALALNGAVGEMKGGLQFHRIVLMITNWERYSSDMFLVPTGRKLPPNPCAELKTRVAISVYSERGALLAGCTAMPRPADLGKFSFLIQKGKPVPDFVYAVIHDRYTGAVYRSNLVSPWTGVTK